MSSGSGKDKRTGGLPEGDKFDRLTPPLAFEPVVEASVGEEDKRFELLVSTNPVAIVSEDVRRQVERMGEVGELGVGGASLQPTGQAEIITPGWSEYLRRRLLTELRTTADAEAKMDLLAAVLDRYGFDVFIGAIPHIGDGAVTGVAVLITFWQALRAGVGLKPGVKMAGFHLADFLIGQIPVLGDLVDLLVKPNEYAAGEFAHRLRTLLDEARTKGVSEDEIRATLQQAEEFRARWEKRMALLEKARKVLLEKLGIKDKPRLHTEAGNGKP